VPGRALAVLAIEEVAHGLTTGFVRFSCVLEFVGVLAAFGSGFGLFGGAAVGAAVGEAGFVGLQFELLFADDADFDGERHFGSMIILIIEGLLRHLPSQRLSAIRPKVVSRSRCIFFAAPETAVSMSAESSVTVRD
jgi:hypothetical protein